MIVRTVYILMILLLAGCASTVGDTVDVVRHKCNEVGAEVVAVFQNDGGRESVKIKCSWTVYEEEEF